MNVVMAIAISTFPRVVGINCYSWMLRMPSATCNKAFCHGNAGSPLALKLSKQFPSGCSDLCKVPFYLLNSLSPCRL